MRVPVRRAPETRVSEQQQGFARPVAPLDLSPIAQLAEGLRDQLLDEQDARQRIDLNRRLITEVNELQVDFAERQRNPLVAAEDFANSTNTLYTDRHRNIVAGLRAEGYSQDLIDDFDTRLGSVRQGFFERGLGHQLVQLRARAGEEIEDIGLQGSQYAAADPINNYASAREMVRNSVRTHPDLTEDERAALEDQQLAVVREGAARALEIQNPQLIIDTFDPEGRTAPYPTTAPAATTADGPAGNPATWRTTPPPEDAGDSPPHFEAAGLTWRDAGSAGRRGGRHGGTMGAVDIAGPRGTPLQIARPFEVVTSRTGTSAAGRRAGNIARIRFPDGAEFDAMHLDDLPAARRYAAGEGAAVIRAGTSGNAAENDPHVHLQAANDRARSLLTQGRRYLAAYLQGGPGLPPEMAATSATTPDSHFTNRSLPRGVRNNNPGNLVNGQMTRSMPGYRGSDGQFAQFETMEQGIAAQEELLRRRLRSGRSITTLIRGTGRNDGFAPSELTGGDNPEASVQHYVNYLSRRLGMDPNTQLSVNDVSRLGEAIRDMEARGWRDFVGRAQTASATTPVRTAEAAPAPTPGQPAVASDVRPANDTAPVPTDPATVRTGNALLDDLSGPERVASLLRARERLTRVTATQRAEMDVRIGNITAEIGNGIATPLPTQEELIRLYGPVEGPQRWAQVQQAVETDRVMPRFRTQSAEAIQRELDAIRPTPGTPTYATELQIYQAAERAAQTLLTQRQQDPAGYVMQHFPAVREAAGQGTAQYYAALDRAYQTLGIDTRTAPMMTAQAAQQLTQNYRTMTPQQRGQFIEQNMEEMGEARFRRFVSGMEGTTAATDARIYALLRSYPGAAQNRNLYNQILEGREIIAQDPARRPREAEVLQVFRQVGLGAVRDLNAETSRSIQEAAEALYAQRGGDPVNINRTMYQEALTSVLGGSLPADMRRGRVTDYTILPPRVSEGQFRTWIERQTIATLTQFGTAQQPPLFGDLRTPAPIQTIIDEGVFVMVSPGYYSIRMSSDGRPLMTRDGNRYIMRIAPQGLMNIGARPAPAAPAPTRRPMGGGVM